MSCISTMTGTAKLLSIRVIRAIRGQIQSSFASLPYVEVPLSLRSTRSLRFPHISLAALEVKSRKSDRFLAFEQCKSEFFSRKDPSVCSGCSQPLLTIAPFHIRPCFGFRGFGLRISGPHSAIASRQKAGIFRARLLPPGRPFDMQILKVIFILLEVLALFNLLIFVHELGHRSEERRVG